MAKVFIFSRDTASAIDCTCRQQKAENINSYCAIFEIVFDKYERSLSNFDGRCRKAPKAFGCAFRVL